MFTVSLLLLVAFVALHVIVSTLKPAWTVALPFVWRRNAPRWRLAGALGVALVVAACASGGGGVTPTTPAQGVYAMQAVLTAAVNLGTQYGELPTCPQSAPLCSTPSVVTSIQLAANAAAVAVDAAEVAVIKDPTASSAATQAAIAAASQALADLTALTTPLKTSAHLR